MVKLTLFSLDALVDVPILMANAFVRALQNEANPAQIHSLLTQKQCDEKRVAVTLAERYKREVSAILLEFYRHLPTGAHQLVYENAFEALAVTSNSKQGIFYGIPQKALQDVVRNANFVVDKVCGSRGGMTTLEVAAEASASEEGADVCYIVGGITGNIPEFQTDDRYRSSRRLRASQANLPVLLDEMMREES